MGSAGVGELVLSMGDFNGHVWKWIEGYECVHGGNGIGKRNVEEKVLLEFITQMYTQLSIHVLVGKMSNSITGD